MGTFHCDDCGQDKPRQGEGGGGTGYAECGDLTVCYDCCAIRDRASMLADGSIILYFANGVITNWPGTLKFPTWGVRKFHHPFTDQAWLGRFTGPDGKVWRFQNLGDSQIARCIRMRGGA